MAKFFLTRREIIVQVFSYVLGLASNAFPTYTTIATSVVVVIYLLAVIVLPGVHPGALLTEARNHIADTRIWLDDEATTRRSSRMYVVTAQGRDSLERVDQRVKALLYQHEKNFTMRKAIRYALALPRLVIGARKCQSDVGTLRSNLEDEVHQLSDS